MHFLGTCLYKRPIGTERNPQHLYGSVIELRDGGGSRELRWLLRSEYKTEFLALLFSEMTVLADGAVSVFLPFILKQFNK